MRLDKHLSLPFPVMFMQVVWGLQFKKPWWYVLDSKNSLKFRGPREAERGEEGVERKSQLELEGRCSVFSSGPLSACWSPPGPSPS